jgi:phage head maturation protease
MLGAHKVFAQIHAGLLNDKSIGWLPTKAHFADVKEADKNNWKEGMLIVEEWLLIEYAVGTIPVNPETVVKVVSKTLKPDDERANRRGLTRYPLSRSKNWRSRCKGASTASTSA